LPSQSHRGDTLRRRDHPAPYAEPIGQPLGRPLEPEGLSPEQEASLVSERFGVPAPNDRVRAAADAAKRFPLRELLPFERFYAAIDVLRASK
jgi:hypothetical protein